MRSLALVAACLACAGHTHSVEHVADKIREKGVKPDLNTLATFLLACSPRSAFTLSSQGTRPVTTNRNAGVKMSTRRMPQRGPANQGADSFGTRDSSRQPLQGSVRQVRQGYGSPAGNSFWNSGSSKQIRQGSGESFRDQGSVRQIRPGSASRGGSNFWDRDSSRLVQGGSLRTWSQRSSDFENYHLDLGTEGRPLDADVQLWDGPNNTPFRVKAYSEWGEPIRAVIPKTHGQSSTVQVRNAGTMEFPLSASVAATDVPEPLRETKRGSWWEASQPVGGFGDTSNVVQGGALRTYKFSGFVESVEITLTSDGMPLQARIELLVGPNRVKEAFEVDSQDGRQKPFSAIVPVSEHGCTVLIYNTAQMTFPLYANVEPHIVTDVSHFEPVIGGSQTPSNSRRETRGYSRML